MEVQREAGQACHFKIVSWFHKKVWVQNYCLPFVLRSLTRGQLRDGLGIYPFPLTLVSSSPVLCQSEAVCIAGSPPVLQWEALNPSGLSKQVIHKYLSSLSLFIIRWRKANSGIFRVKEMTSVTPLQDPSLRSQPTILRPIDTVSESTVKVYRTLV